MKKLVSLLVALAVCLCLGTVAFASSSYTTSTARTAPPPAGVVDNTGFWSVDNALLDKNSKTIANIDNRESLSNFDIAQSFARADKCGKNLTVRVSQKDASGNLNARFYLKAAHSAELQSSGITVLEVTSNARLAKQFGKFFDNDLQVANVYMSQGFKDDMEVAVKLVSDLADKTDIAVYAYDAEQNKVVLLEDTVVDAQGFVHFNAKDTGSFVIVDGKLGTAAVKAAEVVPAQAAAETEAPAAAEEAAKE